jgi:hypothetical protein
MVEHGVQLQDPKYSLTITNITSNNNVERTIWNNITYHIVDACCRIEQKATFADCQLQNLTRFIAIPRNASVPYAGHTLCLNITVNDTTTIGVDVPGGLWVVKAMWTESGYENALAVWQNLYVIMGWVALFLLIGLLVPGWTTARQLFARDLVPDRLLLAADILESTNDYDAFEPENLFLESKENGVHQLVSGGKYELRNGSQMF